MCPRLRLRTRARERAGLPGHPAASARCLLPAGLPPWPQSLPTASPPRGGRSTVPGRWRAGCDPGTPAPRASHRGLSNAAPRAPLACWSLSPEVCKVRRRPGVRPPAQGAGLRGHHRKDPAPSPQPRQPCRTRWLAWPRGATFARWGGGVQAEAPPPTPLSLPRDVPPTGHKGLGKLEPLKAFVIKYPVKQSHTFKSFVKRLCPLRGPF